MAKLTACFALSAVLVLATGICSGNGQVLEDPFPTDPVTGCLRFDYAVRLPIAWPRPGAFEYLADLPPLRIISRGDTSLSIAADNKGNAVLTKSNCSDLRQLWVQHFPYTGDNRFALVNLATRNWVKAMMVPKDRSYPVKVEAYGHWEVPTYVLWRQEAPLSRDGFYKIRSCYKDQRLVLDGLLGHVHEGTVVGAYPAHHAADNVLWKMESFLSYHP